MQKHLLWKFTIPVLVMIITSIFILSWYLTIFMKDNAEQEALLSAQSTATQYKNLRGYYTRNVIKKILDKGELTPSFDHKGDPDKVPLPATMIHDLSKLMEKDGVTLKLYSEFPFPNRASRRLDDFGKQAWAQLSVDISNPFTRTEVINGVTTVRVGIADLMTADSCVNCHNSHPDTPKNDWKLGDLRGVLEVAIPIENQLARAQQLSIKLVVIMMIAVVLVFIAMYITDRKQFRQALTESNTQLDLVLKSTAVGIWDWDLNSNYMTFNYRWAEIIGYTLEELTVVNMDKWWKKNCHPDDYRMSAKLLEQHWRGETDHHVSELRMRHKKGHWVWVYNAGKVIEWHRDGMPKRMIGTSLDITERKQMEKQLTQSARMEAVGQLTGGIAHDFNNLLSIIRGNLRFLQQDIGETSDAINELFEDAMSAADDGAELTQRLLAFSRNRALKPGINNVNDIIEKFTRFLSRTLGTGIELNIDVPDEDLYINVDLSQMENALLNLSINARDAMEQGGKITISAIQYHHGDGDGDGDEYSLTLTEGDYIKVSITDTGTGISSEDLPHVYEPFFTTKEVGKGSGLGLSMVYGFIQQSEGACHIKSTPGEGTTVSMYFPEIPESKKIEKAKVIDELAIRGAEVILVVEDEPRVRRVTLRDLKKLGYKTLEAENAAVAKAIIESGEPIDLLFSDILMPGEMDGHMLGIWTEENHPEIKVVLTSGYSKGKEDVDRDKAHLFPLVRKPYSINALAKQIRTMLTELT